MFLRLGLQSIEINFERDNNAHQRRTEKDGSTNRHPKRALRKQEAII